MTAPFTPIAGFAPNIRALFEQAGWYPGRQQQQAVDGDYPPAIQAVEREVGGLTVGVGSRLTFTSLRYVEDIYHGELLGRVLHPIGHSEDYWDLCVDEHGSVYLIGNWLVLLGMTFREGITRYLEYGTLGSLTLNEELLTWGADKAVITWPDLPPAS